MLVKCPTIPKSIALDVLLVPIKMIESFVDMLFALTKVELPAIYKLPVTCKSVLITTEPVTVPPV